MFLEHPILQICIHMLRHGTEVGTPVGLGLEYHTPVWLIDELETRDGDVEWR